MTSVTDPNGHTTTYAYDHLNRLTSSTDPLGQVTSYEYAANSGQPSRIVDPSGRSIRYAYDALGRTTEVTDDLDHSTALTHDPFGHILTATDARDVTTEYQYDELYHLKKVLEDSGVVSDHATEYAYDAVGNLLSVKDPRQKLSEYTYTARNQLATAGDPLDHTWTQGYDVVGRLESVLDPNGVTTELGYDDVGRPVSVEPGSDPAITYGYDAAGNRLSMSDGQGDTTYTYDSLDRLTSVASGGDTVHYDYDDAGNRTDLEYPDGRHLRYVHDAADRLTWATFGGQFQGAYRYDSAGRVVSGTVGSGSAPLGFFPRYDEASRLTRMLWSGPQGYTFTYSLDEVGNRLSEESAGGTPGTVVVDPICFVYLPFVAQNQGVSGALPQSAPVRAQAEALSLEPFARTVSYSYDDLYRVTGASATPDVTYTFGYDYDAAGNRTSSDGPEGGGGTRSYTYDDAGRLTVVNGQAYTWDDNGNLLSDGVRTFEYDRLNRLVRVSGTLTTEYVYNGDGDLVEQTVDGVSTRYTLDPTGLSHILAAETGGQTTAYLYALGLVGEETGGQRLFYGTDGLGSVRFVVDDGGDLVGRYEYGPFGEVYGQGGSADPLFRYAGEPYAAASGLTYLRARQYDPTLGRFLTRDSFPGVMGAPQTLHPYVYAGNNPVNLTDPSGEIAPLLIAAVVGGLLGGGGAYFAYHNMHPCADFFQDAGFRQAVGAGMLTGVAGGAASMAVGGAFVALAGTGLGGVIQLGIVSGAVYGGASQLSGNVISSAISRSVTWQSLTQGLDRAVVQSALVGGTLGGAYFLGSGLVAPGTTPPTANRPASSPNYSVFFETELRSGTDFPGQSAYRHFQEANRQLYQAMQADTNFARELEGLYPGVGQQVAPGSRGAFSGSPPMPGELVWHHNAIRPGILQLIPYAEHTAPGPIQQSLHPYGRGGMENWGGGY